MKLKKTVAMLALLLVLVLAFAACANDAEKIVGTWKAQQTTLGVVTEVTLTLNEDGTGTQSGLLGLTGDITYTMGEDTLTINAKGLLTESSNTYTYTLKGDTLTLTADSVSLTYTRIA